MVQHFTSVVYLLDVVRMSNVQRSTSGPVAVSLYSSSIKLT